jgi:hypothetical protein
VEFAAHCRQASPLATVAGVNVLLWAMTFYETTSYDER